MIFKFQGRVADFVASKEVILGKAYSHSFKKQVTLFRIKSYALQYPTLAKPLRFQALFLIKSYDI